MINHGHPWTSCDIRLRSQLDACPTLDELTPTIFSCFGRSVMALNFTLVERTGGMMTIIDYSQWWNISQLSANYTFPKNHGVYHWRSLVAMRSSQVEMALRHQKLLWTTQTNRHCKMTCRSIRVISCHNFWICLIFLRLVHDPPQRFVSWWHHASTHPKQVIDPNNGCEFLHQLKRW